MAETTTVTDLDPAAVQESTEVSDADLETIVGGAYAPTCTCTNAACQTN